VGCYNVLKKDILVVYVMEYTLMNKNVAVLQLNINDATGNIDQITSVHNTDYLPVGIKVRNAKPDKGELDAWWKGRSIPGTRDGVKDVLSMFGVSDTKELLTKCFGLSLSDQYWVCPQNKDVQWKNLNFFQNDFSKDVGDAFFGREFMVKKDINFMSPDNTSDGWLKKKWVIIDDDRYLVKAGSKPFFQEPCNEVLASGMLKRLDAFSYAEYSLQEDCRFSPKMTAHF
jgi:hypothetical protein